MGNKRKRNQFNIDERALIKAVVDQISLDYSFDIQSYPYKCGRMNFESPFPICLMFYVLCTYCKFRTKALSELFGVSDRMIYYYIQDIDFNPNQDLSRDLEDWKQDISEMKAIIYGS